MASTVDQKTYWDLFETLRWISTRDEQLVAALWDRSDEERAALAISGMIEQVVVPAASGLTRRDIGDLVTTARRGKLEISRRDDPMGVGRRSTFDDLLRRVHSGRVRMTAVRCSGHPDKQVAVPLAELNDLEFRLTPGHSVAVCGLWSRSRDVMVWRSPQFLRTDVVNAWPAARTKTAAVRMAILRHLREIMVPEAPLTKAEARQRCLAEVPKAYSAAFEKAWRELEAPRKRGRGKHGRRAP